MEISVVSPFLTFGPVFVLITAFFFLGETLSLKQIGGLALIVLGAYTLEISKKHDMWEPFRIIKKSKYIHYILFALILYAASATIGRYLLNESYAHHVSPYLFLPLMHFFIAINFVILISIFHDGLKGIQHGMRNAGKWIFCVSIFIVAARTFWFIAVAMPIAKVGLLQAIKRTSALFATVIGGELFHERNLMHKIVACMIMLLGVYFIII